MEATQTEIANPTEWNLSVFEVYWARYFNLSEASIGQIIYCFYNIISIVPKKVYDEVLYEYLKPAIWTLLKEYSKILNCNSQTEKDVKYFNLIRTMPNGTSVYPEEHGKIKLGKPKIGALIKAMKQRITFILERETPQIYLNNQEMLSEFLNMKIQLQEFYTTVRNFEQEFVLAIDEAHKAQQRYYNQLKYNETQ